MDHLLALEARNKRVLWSRAFEFYYWARAHVITKQQLNCRAEGACTCGQHKPHTQHMSTYLSNSLLTQQIDGWHNRLWLTLINQRTHNAANTIMRARPKKPPSSRGEVGEAKWIQSTPESKTRALLFLSGAALQMGLFAPNGTAITAVRTHSPRPARAPRRPRASAHPRLNYVTPSWPHVTWLARRSQTCACSGCVPAEGLTHSCFKFSKSPCRIKIYCSDDLMCTGRRQVELEMDFNRSLAQRYPVKLLVAVDMVQQMIQYYHWCAPKLVEIWWKIISYC